DFVTATVLFRHIFNHKAEGINGIAGAVAGLYSAYLRSVRYRQNADGDINRPLLAFAYDDHWHPGIGCGTSYQMGQIGLVFNFAIIEADNDVTGFQAGFIRRSLRF